LFSFVSSPFLNDAVFKNLNDLVGKTKQNEKKVVAFLAGRVFRKWWRRLPQEQRDQHRRRVSDKKSYIVGQIRSIRRLHSRR